MYSEAPPYSQRLGQSIKTCHGANTLTYFAGATSTTIKSLIPPTSARRNAGLLVHQQQQLGDGGSYREHGQVGLVRGTTLDQLEPEIRQELAAQQRRSGISGAGVIKLFSSSLTKRPNGPE